MSADVLDEKKAGWSRHCLANNFDLCEGLKFRCANARHRTEGETPDERRDRLLAEARARLDGEAPADDVGKPDAPSMLTRLVLTALVAEGGEVVHASGRATGVLRTCCGYEGSGDSFRDLVNGIEARGLLECDRKHTRTYRIGILDAGVELIGADPSQLTKIHPPAPEPEVVDDVDVQADEPTAVPPDELEQLEQLVRLEPHQQHEVHVEEETPEPEPEPANRGGGARQSPSSTPKDPRDAKVELVWEEPSARTNGRYGLAEILEAEGVFETLRSRPGDWARVITYGSNSSASKAVTKLRKEPTLTEFEWMSKRAPLTDGQQANGSLLYGRYTGEATA